jgi:hypothetical protein
MSDIVIRPERLSGGDPHVEFTGSLGGTSKIVVGPYGDLEFTLDYPGQEFSFVGGPITMENLVVGGDLTVNGATTTINSVNLEVKDAVVGLGFASGTISETAGDRGLIAGLAGGVDHATFLWKNVEAEFVLGRTQSSATGSLPISLTSYSNLHVADIQASIVTASLGFTGSLTKLVNGEDYLRSGAGITLATGSSGEVTITSTITQVSPGSPDAGVQYNSGGGFAASANFTFANNTVFLSGSLLNGDQTTTLSGRNAHAEGFQTLASGYFSHTEGFRTTGSNFYAHAEGRETVAEGNSSHAEGWRSETFGQYSHAGGIWTIASGSGQTVFGKYNKRDNTDSLFVIGNGDFNTQRRDIFLVNENHVMVGSASLNSDTFFYVGTKATATNARFDGNAVVSGTLNVKNGSDLSVLSVNGSKVGIGTESPNYKLEVNGDFAATTKSFVIDHPSKSGWKLRHGSLEGPENGVYVRGRTSSNEILLPSYWKDLVHEDSITVQITPIGRKQSFFVVSTSTEKIVLQFDLKSAKSVEYFYLVQAERKDAAMVVEYEDA